MRCESLSAFTSSIHCVCKQQALGRLCGRADLPEPFLFDNYHFHIGQLTFPKMAGFIRWPKIKGDNIAFFLKIVFVPLAGRTKIKTMENRKHWHQKKKKKTKCISV